MLFARAHIRNCWSNLIKFFLSSHFLACFFSSLEFATFYFAFAAKSLELGAFIAKFHKVSYAIYRQNHQKHKESKSHFGMAKKTRKIVKILLVDDIIQKDLGVCEFECYYTL